MTYFSGRIFIFARLFGTAIAKAIEFEPVTDRNDQNSRRLDQLANAGQLGPSFIVGINLYFWIGTHQPLGLGLEVS